MKEMAPEDRLRSANARVGNAQFKLGLAKARRLETRHWERELRDALADRAAALAALADDTTGGDTMTNEPPPFTDLALDAPVTARDIAAEIGVYCDSAGENYTLRAVNPDGSPGDVLAFVPGGAAVAFALAEPYNAAQADAGGEATR